LLKALFRYSRGIMVLEYTVDMVQTIMGLTPLSVTYFSFVDEGDEVIVPSPYWVTYPELVKYSGGDL